MKKIRFLNNDKKSSRLYFSFCCLFILSLALVGIVAYMADADTASNTFKVGSNTVEIDEEFDPPEEIKPGTSFVKDVKVKNVEGADCYVRVKVVFDNSLMEQNCEVDWNTTDWIYNSTDGYWYYTEILSEGESTSSLFTTVTIKDAIPEDAVVDFNIIVYAESVESHQGQGFESYEDAWQHYQKNKSN